MQTGRCKLGRIYAQLVQKRPEIISVFVSKICFFFFTAVVCFMSLVSTPVDFNVVDVKCVLTNLESLAQKRPM